MALGKLAHGFAPCDSRSHILAKLGPFAEGSSQAIETLAQYLVSDSYGDVAHVRIARDAYNSRPGVCEPFLFFYHNIVAAQWSERTVGYVNYTILVRPYRK